MKRNPSITPSKELRDYVNKRRFIHNERGATRRINEMFIRYRVMRDSLAAELTPAERNVLQEAVGLFGTTNLMGLRDFVEQHGCLVLANLPVIEFIATIDKEGW